MIMRRDVTKVGVLMSEIKSDASIVEEYVTGIRAANSILASDNSTMTEDDITNLAVTGNGTELYELSKQGRQSPLFQVRFLMTATE